MLPGGQDTAYPLLIQLSRTQIRDYGLTLSEDTFLFSRLLVGRHFCMRLAILTSCLSGRTDHGLASFHCPDIFVAHRNRGANNIYKPVPVPQSH